MSISSSKYTNECIIDVLYQLPTKIDWRVLVLQNKYKKLNYVILCWILKIHEFSIIKLYTIYIFGITDYFIASLMKEKNGCVLELLHIDLYFVFRKQNVKNIEYVIFCWIMKSHKYSIIKSYTMSIFLRN